MSPVVREHGALRENLVTALREDIVSGRFPPGTPLRTEVVMQRFGVSNSPLREAFAQLASEGLVVVQRNRGATVAPLNRANAADVFRVSGLLMEHVIRWGLPRTRPGDVTVLRRISLDFDLAFRSGDIVTAFAESDRFGEALLELSGSRELARALRTLLPQLRRLVRLLDPLDYLTLQGSLQAAVLASAEDHDAESAVIAVTSIWRQVERAVDALGDDVIES